MAYYTALINAWNGATQPPTGVTGTGLTSSMTTSVKLATVNAWTIAATPGSVWHASAQQVAECVNINEFTALTTSTRMEVWAILALDFPLLGGTTSIIGQIARLMPNSSCTLTYANFVALAATVAGTGLWWQVNGYPAPFNLNDTAAAGLS